MTSEGASVTASTLLKDIDGYNTFTAGDYISLTGTDTANVAVNSNFSITSATTVQNLLDEITTRYGNVLAYVTNDGKIRVDDLSGGSFLALNLTDHIADPSSTLEFVAGDANFLAADARQRQIIAGEDATIVLDGVAITKNSNTVNDVITGVTMNLLKEDAATTVSLTVGRDLDAVKKTINDYVSKYNDLMSYISTQFSYDASAQQAGGLLFGDGTLSSIKSDISNLITGPIWGVNSNFSIIGMIGINLDNNQQLTVDDELLSGYLKTNFNDVLALFTAQGTTSSTNLAYVSYTKDSKAGEYAVQINRAATRGAETGNVVLTAGGKTETLSVTQGTNTANIAVTPAMTISDIVNAANTEFAASYTENLAGSQQLKQSDGSTALTATTTWDNIFGAALQDSDVISFSGTSRSGATLSGSYTIADKSTDTVQGMLTAIEAAFGNAVSAAIDTSGRINLTDKYNGTSQLALDITEPAGRGLDFGTVLASNAGGVEGRYAIALTAADDGSGHLTITNNDYGDGSGFTISQDSADNFYDQMIYTTTANTTAATSGDVHVTAATTWSDVNGAGVVNGDTITIGGTARDGVTAISATYTVTNTATDTISGLLAAIESAYSAQGTTVDAVIREGKIYIEDMISGASSVSLTLTANNEGGGSLALGTFDQNTKRDLDLGLVNGTYSGQDVAGTINGEAALGSGQTLTGAAGNASTAGLSVQYTGSANGAAAGNVKLTLGLGALLSNTLLNISDPINGYLTFKETSLEESISGYQTRISDMEARLALKQEAMIARFTAMEMAISNIQSQSNWLTAQLGAAITGWK
jgi:flagellar hook-associated protein 2